MSTACAATESLNLELTATPAPEEAFVLSRNEELNRLLSLASLNRMIESHNEQIAKLRQDVRLHEAALIASATATGRDIEEAYGYRVQLNKGRTTTSWDAATLDQTLPDEIRMLALSYTPKADSRVLNALADAGKFPKAALAARTITLPQPRMIVKRVPE